MGFLHGKRALIVGIASKLSIAYGIAQAMHREGAELAFTYQNEKLKGRVEEFAKTFGSTLTFPCDVVSDAEIDAVADGGPQPAADENNEKTHDLSFMLTGRQSRPGAERCPTAARASAPAKRPGLPGCLAELLRNQTR